LKREENFTANKNTQLLNLMFTQSKNPQQLMRPQTSYSSMTWMKGQSVPSASLLMTQRIQVSLVWAS